MTRPRCSGRQAPRFLLLLTATPVENELYNLVTVLRPGQFATPAEFRRRFVDPREPTRPRHTEDLPGLLSEVMVRNTRAHSGLALPPRFVSTVVVDPSEEERTLYERVLETVREMGGQPSGVRHVHEDEARRLNAACSGERAQRRLVPAAIGGGAREALASARARVRTSAAASPFIPATICIPAVGQGAHRHGLMGDRSVGPARAA